MRNQKNFKKYVTDENQPFLKKKKFSFVDKKKTWKVGQSV